MNVNYPPGPYDGRFGITFHWPLRKDPLGFAAQMAREYGDFSAVRIGWVRIYFVNRPELIREVLATKVKSFRKLGRQMRAVASDREAAEMLGINVDYTISATFFLGSALAGIAGVMAGLVFNQIYTLMGFIIGLKAFTAAVVGGIGSIPGAMLGGFLIGIAESFITGYISSTFTNLIVFGILIVVA